MARGRADGRRVLDMSPAIDQITSDRSGQAGRKLFVGNLPFGGTTESDLRSHFEQCGAVIEVSIRRDKNGLPSFGFVTFEKEGDARAALEQLNHSDLNGRFLTLAFAHRQA